jgi:hypothetical protein
MRGLPSTEDIETMSYFLGSMKITAALKLYMPIHRVLISMPHLPNLQPGDFSEALELTGLTNLKSYKHYGPLYQTNAAWAGLGNGLCEHWEDIEKCELEELDLQNRLTLTVSFTEEELIADVSIVVNAHTVWNYRRERYPDLGYGSWKRNESNTTFWQILGEKVLEITEMGDMDLEELLLIGEYGENKKFLDTLWNALGGVKGVDIQALWRPLQTSRFNATYIAARGSAELAKRWQGETWGCIEGEWCKSNKGLKEDL